MIVVELKDGRSVDVEGSAHANFVDDAIPCLRVYDEAGTKLLASFIASEVIFYHVEDEKEKTE